MALTVGPGRREPARVVVFTRAGCGLCREAEELVAAEARGADVELVDIDAADDEDLLRRYHVRVPVVTVDGREVAEGHLAPGTVRRALRRARHGRWAFWRRA